MWIRIGDLIIDDAEVKMFERVGQAIYIHFDNKLLACIMKETDIDAQNIYEWIWSKVNEGQWEPFGNTSLSWDDSN